ncbi:ATP-binding protein [Streptomyces sp. NBC_01789]|uniref:ATP-binding protein n=1 Tax=Streptomyces sp. NBC_01789 TaxID=2975941 RepID=UPI002259FA87|nr:ATP-binding protein [Streptomyces sp. NBC_01789]MCX4450640.1 ATP-binding protein [Streptomyces sp. NBC_01789]
MTTKNRIDFAAYGIPPGVYALPGLAQARAIADGTEADELRIADRFTRHFTGQLPVSELAPAEYQLIRDDFHEQVADRREQALARFTRAVPRRFANAVPEEQATTWAATTAADLHSARSLLFTGTVGTGKTHRAWSVLRAIAETGANVPFRAITEADLFALLRPGGSSSPETELEALASVDVLYVDDLGAAKNTEWTEEITYRLINRRYEACRPCIFTTNSAAPELPAVVGDRIASRLRQMCDLIPMTGDDRRKEGTQ